MAFGYSQNFMNKLMEFDQTLQTLRNRVSNTGSIGTLVSTKKYWVLYMQISDKLTKFHNAKSELVRSCPVGFYENDRHIKIMTANCTFLGLHHQSQFRALHPFQHI